MNSCWQITLRLTYVCDWLTYVYAQGHLIHSIHYVLHPDPVYTCMCPTGYEQGTSLDMFYHAIVNIPTLGTVSGFKVVRVPHLVYICWYSLVIELWPFELWRQRTYFNAVWYMYTGVIREWIIGPWWMGGGFAYVQVYQGFLNSLWSYDDCQLCFNKVWCIDFLDHRESLIPQTKKYCCCLLHGYKSGFKITHSIVLVYLNLLSQTKVMMKGNLFCQLSNYKFGV